MPSVPLIEPGDRAHIQCKRCRIAVVWPSSLTPQQAEAVAKARRQDTLKGVEFAEKQLGLGAREAKAMALHITRVPGICHKCGKAVLKGESICVCRSANLDW